MDFLLPATGKFTVYSKSGCIFCNKAKTLLIQKSCAFEQIDCDEYLLSRRDGFLAFIAAIAGREYRTFPMVFDPSGGFVGGFAEIKAIFDRQLEFEEEF